MITTTFRLKCDDGHEWDEVRHGDSASIGIALCPVCGDREVAYTVLSVEVGWLMWPLRQGA